MQEIIGVGFGHRPELHKSVSEHLSLLDFVEVAPELFYAPQYEDFQKETLNLAQKIPVSLHGLTLSIGSAKPVKAKWLQRVKALAKSIQAPWVSDHLAFTATNHAELELYMAPAFSPSTLSLLKSNIQQATEILEMPLHLENIGLLSHSQNGEFSEGDFFKNVYAPESTKMILNLDSVLVSAFALKQDPIELLKTYPLHAVESITYVPEVAMNIVMQKYFGETVTRKAEGLLDFALKNSSAKSVLIQARYDHNTVEALSPVIHRVREIFWRNQQNAKRA